MIRRWAKNCHVRLLAVVWLIIAAQDANAFIAMNGQGGLRYDRNFTKNPKKSKKLLIRNDSCRQSNPSTKIALSVANGGQSNSRLNLAPVKAFIQRNMFLLGMAIAVCFAKTFPTLGENGGALRPELFIGRFGVTMIFLISGISLELSELKDAFSNLKLNAAIQACTFLLWPILVGIPLTKGLAFAWPDLLPSTLLDGLLILTCLPTTVNMCIFLTSAAGGNVAAALCNAVISNLAGIFVTPALLLRFFGTEVQLPFLEMVVKLCNKVLLPVAVGQALRQTKAKNLYESNSKKFKRLQEFILVGIVWNAFCNAFSKGLGLQFRHALTLLILLPTLHVGSLGVLFKIFANPLWKLSRGDVVAGMFCASHKTLAFGLPLVNTIFEGNNNLAAYCAPIMFIHPLQLFLGSLLVPRTSKYVQEGKESWKNQIKKTSG